MRTVYLAIIVGIANLMLVSCSEGSVATTQSKQISNGEMIQELAAFDFSQYLAQCDYVTLDEASAPGHELQDEARVLRERLSRTQSPAQLTEKDYGVLLAWKLPDGMPVTIVHTMMVVDRYYQKHHALPSSGLEAMPRLLTPEGYSHFMALAPEAKLHDYRFIINPISGKFYESYQSQQWTPGGINITIIDDPSIVAEQYAELRVPVGYLGLDGEVESPHAIWLVRFYGETPGSVIWDYTWAR